MKISTVMEAFRYLADCPTSVRDRSYTVARNACSAAIAGDIEAETVRGLFAAFAERHQILAPEFHAGIVGPDARSGREHARLS
ncbi:DUF982 domain-containing protein [Rhizobium populisoli]|uniref:DUF982 domain-containing protein n=1 Tax=Rhizobium populisoli TaxID=2859785 RepID=UPI0028AD7B9C|nr:DUF982 domain-containing protein [Rhizobium populisoli]